MKITATSKLPSATVHSKTTISDKTLGKVYDPKHYIYQNIQLLLDRMIEDAATEIRKNFRLDAYPEFRYSQLAPEHMTRDQYEQYLEEMATYVATH